MPRVSSSTKNPIKNNGLLKNFQWLFVFSVASNLLLLALPLHMIAIYDRVLTSRSGETLLYITLIALLALVLLGVAEAVRSMIAQRMSAQYVTGTAGKLFSGLIHSEEDSGRRSQLMRDFCSLRTFLGSRTLVGLFDLPFTPFFLTLLFVLHVQLGFITLIGIGLLAGLAYCNRRLSVSESEEATRTNSEAVAFSQALVYRAEDIRAMGLFPAFLRRWGSQMDSSMTHADRASQVQAFFFGLTRTVRQSLQIIIMAWGAYLVLAGDLSGGVIFAASLISSRAFVPVEQVIGGWDSIVHARGSYANLADFVESQPEQRKAVIPGMTTGDIEVENLTFEIDAGSRVQTILRNVSFSLQSGAVLAVIGPSGAGKSTLAKLLSGALQPSEGSVRLDGFELNLWPDDRKGESIGYVPQDSTLFPGTIAENISRYEAHPNEDAIISAARKANIHSQIVKMPEAYATMVGPGYHEMSGGQQQQLAMARAFFARPRLLILDEPNAHLDQKAEDSLLRSLAEAREDGVSSIVVSQRRSILKIADYVLTLNEGQVVSFKENHGQWRARRGDDRDEAPRSAQDRMPAKPEVLVEALNAAKPRMGGQVRVEAG